MQSATRIPPISPMRRWAGRIISLVPALLLLVDAVMKFIKPEPVVKETVRLGYAEAAIVPIGIVLLICTVLYVIPRTSVLGAILLTGYLGGAVSTHVRMAEGWFPIVFPVVFGAILWLESTCAMSASARLSRFDRRGYNNEHRTVDSSGGSGAAIFVCRRGQVVLPIDTLTSMGSPNQIHLPGLFIKFIGVCEVLGALGLILPGLLRIRRGLTPLAAAGLVIILIGATVLTFRERWHRGGAWPIRVWIACGVRSIRTMEAGTASLNQSLRSILFVPKFVRMALHGRPSLQVSTSSAHLPDRFDKAGDHSAKGLGELRLYRTAARL